MDRKDRNLELFRSITAARQLLSESDGRGAARAQRRVDSLVAQLHQENFPLVLRIVRRSGAGAINSRSGHDELVAAASLGLYEAIATWDPTRSSLSNWAWRLINKQVLAEVAASEHGLNPHQYTSRWHVLRALDALTRNLGRRPTAEELAAECQLTVRTVRFILDHEASGQPVRLDAPAGRDDPGSSKADTVTTAEVTGTPDIALGTLAEATADLPISAVWCGLRFTGLDGGFPQHAHEIGADVHRSRETVRQQVHAFTQAIREHLD